MKIKVFLALVCFSMLILSGCTNTPVKPEKTQLQIREMQTRYYDTTNPKMVMKAALNALQDESFIVKNANLDLGFLTAAKDVDIEKSGDAWMSRWFGDGRYRKNRQIEANVNVSEYGEQIRVRATFQTKTFDNEGKVLAVRQIEDLNYYQDFFSKMSKSIFIQSEGL